jgi:anti-sigma factor RsiW
MARLCCADFEASFDQYVDGRLSDSMAAAAAMHLTACPECDRGVARWQQTRILLSTAVADFAPARDVCGLWRGVEAALGKPAESDRGSSVERATPPRRAAAASRDRRSGRAEREARSERVSGLSAAWRFAAAATGSASVAAAAVLYFSPVSTVDSSSIASVRTVSQEAVTRFSGVPSPAAALPGSVRPASFEPSPARVAPPVEDIEAAPGHVVSTWVQPRTNARVIWVQNKSFGAPVQTADLRR